MATSKLVLSLFLLLIALHEIVPAKADNQGLKVGFYEKTCPQAEAIVKEITDYTFSVALPLSGPLMRMHFHDCFVRVCTNETTLSFFILYKGILFFFFLINYYLQ